MNQFEKLKITLRYFLLGREYYMAADALEYAAQYHTGFRKDGVTPEFQHQIEIAHYVRTLLPSLMFPEDTIAAVLLHDVPEDYGVPHAEISNRFGPKVGRAVFLMDKNSNANFAAIGEDPIASIAKGGDRSHNLQSMQGVFTREKQLKYIAEARNDFLPMLKTARRLFPKQEAAYENIKHMLNSQLELLEALNATE
jgi:(p)ppGpp synthase/HD superfamily hydrolase